MLPALTSLSHGAGCGCKLSAADLRPIVAGLLIHIGDRLVYHLGDTCLFSDMKLIARRGDKVDLALVPIGGHYTMDRFDAVTAVEVINPAEVIPCHYNTFPPIEADAEAFKKDVQDAGFSQVTVLEPGGTHTVK
jgi:L-ascorbate metabolism protein UlaG (beta-lactamase superfamily)